MATMPIEVALYSYCLLHVVPPIVNGTPRRASAHESWDMLRRARFTAKVGVTIPDVGEQQHSTRCVANICQSMLTTQFDVANRPMMTVPSGVPGACLVAADLVRRLMLGEQPGDALRNAFDARAGRQPRRRAPVPDAEVLRFTVALLAKLEPSLRAADAL